MYNLKIDDFKYTIKGNNLCVNYLLIRDYEEIRILNEYCIDGKNYIVNEFDNFAFLNVESSIIIIPDTTEKIGNNAFEKCKIKFFEIPKNIKEISKECFSYCPNLREIVLHENIETINRFAFAESGIERIQFNCNVKTIPEGCFYGCKNLKEIVFNDKVEKISFYSFAGSSIEKFICPEKLKEIPINCFNDCRKLKKIVFNNNLKLIKNRAFDKCQNINIFYWNDKDIKIDSYSDLEQKGFNLSQINQIFKGYEQLIFLNEISIDVPDYIIRFIVKNFEKNSKKFCKLIDNLNVDNFKYEYLDNLKIKINEFI